MNSNQNRRVLVVDDNQAIHDDFRKILQSRSRPIAMAEAEKELFGVVSAPVTTVFELDSAFQGEEAVDLVKQARAEGRPYAMAFVDVRMPPGWDGIETTERIWSIDPDMQMVICTAYSDYSWPDVRRRLGHSDRLLILKKPFDNIEALQLATALTEKWSLFQQVKRQVDELEETVRRRTAQLRESEERYRLITESAGDLIGVVNAQGAIIYRSPSYERLLGYSAEELKRFGAFEWIEPADRAAVHGAAVDCQEQGKQRVCEFRARRKDGTCLVLESTLAPFRDASGCTSGVLLVTRDVTERHDLELQLRQALKLESIGRLAAGIAHEVNTPTQFIADNSHFLKDAFQRIAGVLDRSGALAAVAAAHTDCAGAVRALAAAEAAAELDYLRTEIPRCLEQSLQGLTRVSRIVCSLKEFAHPRSPDLAPADLNAAIETALVVSRHEWKYVAEVVTELDPELPPVPCVADEMNQVLLNLIINAAHAIADALKQRGGERGCLTIRTRREEPWAMIEVEDNGTGIASGIRERIFDPFFTTKPVGKGTGQGLAIVHAAVVKHHHGRIDVHSQPGAGSRFVLRLPLAAPLDAAVL